MGTGQMSQVGCEEPRNPLAGGHAYHSAGVIPEGQPAALDGGGGVGHALRHRQQMLAPLRQAVAVRRALENARAQALLELTQVADHRGLAHSERASGSPQAAGLGDGEKHAKVIPAHGASLATSTGSTCFESGAGRSTLGGFRPRRPGGALVVQGGRATWMTPSIWPST